MRKSRPGKDQLSKAPRQRDSRCGCGAGGRAASPGGLGGWGGGGWAKRRGEMENKRTRSEKVQEARDKGATPPIDLF